MVSLLGKNIKELRESKGFSKAELARTAGVSKSVISEIESGSKSNLSGTTILKLSEALNVGIEALYGTDSSHISIYEVLNLKSKYINSLVNEIDLLKKQLIEKDKQIDILKSLNK
ncbi:helix-turn-helix domain-containing protein [Clostridium baratii]|uniref:helix-turn-helix domain-containing protein n=1 Tax=Clostridium baratii TaxID=1561 RepID=UPI00097FBDA0|nr:helix-turn-helix transcriptional regulator [Clostridium baratii]AQM58591.1 hypothetical protein NPD11_3028 [Clostridium baratii]